MKEMLKYTIFSTNNGFFGLLASMNGLLSTSLPMPTKQAAKCCLLRDIDNAQPDQNLLPSLQKDIKSYYKGCYIDFSNVKVSLPAFTDFGIDILTACSKVKFGKTVTYSRLASLAKHPRSARAVGNILAKNPIPLIIPCHRIIRSDGTLGGFSAPAGVIMKQNMLLLESKIK